MNTLDGDGYSPFHKAVQSDDANILRYFIQNSANLKAKDIDGDKAFEVALKKKKQYAVKLLLQDKSNL